MLVDETACGQHRRLIAARSAVCLSLAMAAVLLTAIDVESQVRFGTEVDAVQFQVRVVDSDGRSVSGLTAADFTVRVDGESRPVTAAYEVNLGGGRSAAAGEATSGGSEPWYPAAAWRQIVLLFDGSFTSPRGVRAAQTAALGFLDNHALAQDLISVVTYSVVEGVQIRTPFTADHRQVRAAVEGLGLTQATRIVDRAGFLTEMIMGDLENLEAPGALAGSAAGVESALTSFYRVVFQAELREYQDYAARYAEQIGELGRVLQAVRGRKHIFFFTTGIDDRVLVGKSLDDLAADADLIQQGRSYEIDPDSRFGSPELRTAIDDAIGELRGADTVLHMVDTAGLGGGQLAGLSGGSGKSPRTSLVSTASSRDSLVIWADGTDGSVIWNENDLAGALGTLSESLQDYYVLVITRRRDDPEVLEIEVEAGGEDGLVTSAPERLAVPPSYASMTEMQRQAQLAEHISKGLEGHGLSAEVVAAVYSGTRSVARVGVVLEIPWQQIVELAAERGDGAVELDLLAYVVAGDGRMVDLTDRHIRLDVAVMGAGKASGLPVRFYDLLWAVPGQYELRVLVRESRLGVLATSVEPLEVPLFTGTDLIATPPVILDAAHPGLVLRLLDSDHPPPSRAGGPTEYPFVVGENELTPVGASRLREAEAFQVFSVAYNLASHPFTGRPEPRIDLFLHDEDGRSIASLPVTVLGRADVPEHGATQLLLGSQMPQLPRSGRYRLLLRISDGITGESMDCFRWVWGVGDAAL